MFCHGGADANQAHGVRDAISRMRDVMMDRKIPESKRKHVIRNFTHYNRMRSIFYNEKEITDELPTMLCEKLLGEFYAENLLTVPEMKLIERDYPLYFLAVEAFMQPCSLIRDEPVVNAGECVVSVFFLVSGGLSIQDQDRNEIKRIEGTGTFGQACLDLPKSDRYFYIVSVKATEHSSLFTLRREKLPDIYRLFPHATNKFVSVLQPRTHRKYIRIYHDKNSSDEYGFGHDHTPYYRCPTSSTDKWPPDPEELEEEARVRRAETRRSNASLERGPNCPCRPHSPLLCLQRCADARELASILQIVPEARAAGQKAQKECEKGRLKLSPGSVGSDSSLDGVCSGSHQ